jgi:NADH-quinone oxidoreductase subunit N
VEAKLWIGVGVAFIAAAAGFYYYLNVVRAMWWTNPGDRAAIILPTISKFCIALFTISVLVFGIYPQPLLALLK